MTIPEIVKAYVLKHNGRMPETQEEIDSYLDLINHAKEYQTSLEVSQVLSKQYMKKLGFKTPKQVKADGKNYFKTLN